ncbi:DcaP family trimeric outer membrane transporter [Rheinheimera sp. SA_1]|uniref:DcaP family trimeric outer membrane transporter n=1 Tax=Rheinheimera sp. SA_1 TaxID=1827365 RepID=UPI000B17A33B|nr:DcaP family trimeric outer membrane transporter [Rheinheimera sp. SA_1]
MQQITFHKGHTRLTQLAATMLTLLVCQSAQAGFKVGDSTEMNVGGYVKLDAMWTDTSDSSIATGVGRDFYVPGLIPVGGASESAKWDMHARQSRFFITSDTMLENGKKISGRFEFDMMGTTIGDQRTSNGYSPEIRHAFVSYDGWTFGQTWSTFMDVNALPDSLDFVGTTDGTVFVRQAMVRYTTGGFQVALENPETTVTPLGGGTRIVTDDNSVPDVVLRYNYTADWGGLTVSGLTRQLSYQQGAIDDSVRTSGVTFSGKLNLSKTDDLRFALTYGDVGRYLSLNTANDAALNANNQLTAISSIGYTLAYKHAWNDKWRSSLFYSAQHIDNPVESTGLAQTAKTSSYSANLIYQLASKVSVGVEFRHATRVLESDLEADLNRIQFSAKYDF